MNESILELRAKLDEAIQNVTAAPELEALKVEYLGKKGSITALLKNMGKLSPEEKKEFGSQVNALKDYAAEQIANKTAVLQEQGMISDRKVVVGKRMTRVYYHIEPAGLQRLEELTRE